LAFLLLGLACASAAAAADPARARSEQPLAFYLSDEDYPAASVRNGEQGAVAFRLSIGADGRPAGCSVTRSSGSAALDATTCRLMMARPRFVPARDSSGKAVADAVEGRIVWRLPDDAPPRPGAALTLWSNCLIGEASKLALSDLPAAEIGRRSLPPCAALEAVAAREMGEPAPLGRHRAEMAAAIETMVLRVAAVLKAKDERQR
jgi:TonB family protein